jgi:hypothetical protein
MTPEQVVQAQVEAYNKHDIEAFMALHSPNIVLYSLPDNSIIVQGLEAIRERYTQRFSNPELHAEIVNRMVLNNRVIDHEHVKGIEANQIVKAIAIYEIEDELIQRVWFIFS